MYWYEEKRHFKRINNLDINSEYPVYIKKFNPPTKQFLIVSMYKYIEKGIKGYLLNC